MTVGDDSGVTPKFKLLTAAVVSLFSYATAEDMMSACNNVDSHIAPAITNMTDNIVRLQTWVSNRKHSVSAVNDKYMAAHAQLQ
jgi:hypothetical protein